MQRVDRVNPEQRLRGCSPNMHDGGHCGVFGVANGFALVLMPMAMSTMVFRRGRLCTIEMVCWSANGGSSRAASSQTRPVLMPNQKNLTTIVVEP